jgi:hypothetical protein
MLCIERGSISAILPGKKMTVSEYPSVRENDVMVLVNGAYNVSRVSFPSTFYSQWC